jgi:ABC-2 type transport system permease protein
VVLSRPISRSAYLTSHVLVGWLGLMVLAGALVLGARAGVAKNVLRTPPDLWILLRPGLNLAFLGLPVYGVTLFCSALDQVRWRPNLVGSMLTLASFIAWVVATIPDFREATWRPWLERVSIFKAYNPVDAINGAGSLGLHLGILAALGLGFVALAYLAFLVRDLPANG